jgi:putative tryptophan/tyrosine transport system substrate-binding protein
VLRNLFSLLLFFMLLTLCRDLAWAGQAIVAVQSINIQPYEDAVQGFESACGAKLNRLVVSELKGTDIVKKIHDLRPDLILAIGPDALSRVIRIKDIPVVYLMVLDPRSMLSGEKNIRGVGMDVPPEKQLRALLDALPQTKTVGLLFARERTGRPAEKAREAARKIGVELLAKEVRNARDVPQAIQDMKGKIDAFWMLPDLTVLTPATIEFMILFSLENKVPILAFSEKYLELGAFMSVGVDAFDMGMQAGEMAEKILSGKETVNGRHVAARKAVISINLKAARKLGIAVDEKVIRKARIIH